VTGLRERKKQETRQLLADTARRLFAEHGFERVSVAEIAREANVSVATVFNYFPTKEDLVYSRLEAFEEELLGTIRDRPPGESVVAAFGRFILQPRGFLAAGDDQAAAGLLEISRLIASSPALLARERRILADYTDSLARLIAEDTGAAPGDPRPRVVATALIGVHSALIDFVRERILAGAPDLRRLGRETRAHGEEALALLEHGLADYGTKASEGAATRTSTRRGRTSA